MVPTGRGDGADSIARRTLVVGAVLVGAALLAGGVACLATAAGPDTSPVGPTHAPSADGTGADGSVVGDDGHGGLERLESSGEGDEDAGDAETEIGDLDEFDGFDDLDELGDLDDLDDVDGLANVSVDNGPHPDEDSRQRVRSDDAPWISIAMVDPPGDWAPYYTDDEDGETSYATGFLVAPNVVVTAGHVVDPPIGGVSEPAHEASDLRIRFGAHADGEEVERRVEAVWTPADYSVLRPETDVAFARLNESVALPTFDYADARDLERDSFPDARTAGYPAITEKGALYTEVGGVGVVRDGFRSDRLVEGPLNASNGHSGGPIWTVIDGNYTAIGVVQGANLQYTRGPTMAADWHAQIEAMADGGEDGVAVASLDAPAVVERSGNVSVTVRVAAPAAAGNGSSDAENSSDDAVNGAGDAEDVSDDAGNASDDAKKASDDAGKASDDATNASDDATNVSDHSETVSTRLALSIDGDRIGRRTVTLRRGEERAVAVTGDVPSGLALERVNLTVATNAVPATENATRSTTVRVVADCERLATDDARRVCDLDADGNYRDVDASGDVTARDLRTFFQRQHRPPWDQRTDLFDFDDDGAVGQPDVVALFRAT